MNALPNSKSVLICFHVFSLFLTVVKVFVELSSFFASSFVIRVNSEFAKFDIAFIFTFSGGYGGGATPDSIPNSEVKTSSADGTAWFTECL